MKQRYTINITMDPEAAREGGVTRKAVGEEAWDVFIAPAPSGSNTLVDTLAHELGHVVADISATKLFQADPRFRARTDPFLRFALDSDFLPPEERLKMFRAEREAWDIGLKIKPDIKRERITEALGSYLRNV